MRALQPERVGIELWLLIDGAFANHDLFADLDPVATFVDAVETLLPTRSVKGRGA